VQRIVIVAAVVVITVFVSVGFAPERAHHAAERHLDLFNRCKLVAQHVDLLAQRATQLGKHRSAAVAVVRRQYVEHNHGHAHDDEQREHHVHDEQRERHVHDLIPPSRHPAKRCSAEPRTARLRRGARGGQNRLGLGERLRMLGCRRTLHVLEHLRRLGADLAADVVIEALHRQLHDVEPRRDARKLRRALGIALRKIRRLVPRVQIIRGFQRGTAARRRSPSRPSARRCAGTARAWSALARAHTP
jgi:hypothetical protein